jgi:hypothetical protein
VRASREVWGHAPPENVGFREAQISYFQHFEEFSNKKLTLHQSPKIKPADLLGLVKSIPATMLFCIIFSPPNTWAGYFPPSLLEQAFFLFRIALQEMFFSKSSPPPSKVKWSAPK